MKTLEQMETEIIVNRVWCIFNAFLLGILLFTSQPGSAEEVNPLEFKISDSAIATLWEITPLTKITFFLDGKEVILIEPDKFTAYGKNIILDQTLFEVMDKVVNGMCKQ